jgi:hypothetical protein
MSLDLDSETKWSSDTSLVLHVTNVYQARISTGGNKNKRGSLSPSDFRADVASQAISGRVVKASSKEQTLWIGIYPHQQTHQLNSSPSLHDCEWPACLFLFTHFTWDFRFASRLRYELFALSNNPLAFPQKQLTEPRRSFNLPSPAGPITGDGCLRIFVLWR